jgi:outer membrane autotransporter protein
VRDNAPQGDYTNKAIWVKPYTSFESIDLKNGPKVDMISYGTLIGGDSDFRRLRNGWSNVGTLYLGYNGSQMDYKGVDTTTNGGLLGLTETFYKGNFFNATTVSAGAGFAESHTMYGKDDITMFMAGVANKTGYNLEFKEGKFIVQPNIMMSYSMVNTFNYTNSAGVKIKSDPLHTIQLNPSIRFIGNLKHGWQPYASVGMVWNLMNDTKVTANNVKLPEMHTKPYIEYGVGVQKHIGDKFSGYLQAMVRNGGRTGIAFTAGFRWTLGEPKARSVDASPAQRKDSVKKTTSKKHVALQGVESSTTQYSLHSNDDMKKTVIKSTKADSQRARTLARYNQLIGE